MAEQKLKFYFEPTGLLQGMENGVGRIDDTTSRHEVINKRWNGRAHHQSVVYGTC